MRHWFSDWNMVQYPGTGCHDDFFRRGGNDPQWVNNLQVPGLWRTQGLLLMRETAVSYNIVCCIYRGSATYREVHHVWSHQPVTCAFIGGNSCRILLAGLRRMCVSNNSTVIRPTLRNNKVERVWRTMVKDLHRNKELGAGLNEWRGGVGIRERCVITLAWATT